MSMETEIVIQERLTQPSMVTPTLFVGLGGCGLRMVQRVQKHLSSRPDYEERYKGLTKFAGVDTNINDLEQVRQTMDDVFLISDFEKEAYARLANGQDYLPPSEDFVQWVPKDYRFRAGDTAGAGQIRIESRLGLYYQVKHRDILPRLRRLLEDLKDHNLGHRRLNSNEIRIVLCYSVAGGTGSGSHLPMAYLLRDLALQLGKPRIFGVAVLPSVFEDKSGRNKDGIFANGYAALKETEHLMKLGAPEADDYPSEGIPFHYNPADSTKTTVKQQPFEFVYIIDRPERFTVDRVIDAAADGLYLQFFAPKLFGVQAGDYDNYTQHQRFLVPNNFESTEVRGFTSFYGSYGAAVLLVPTDGLVDYCARAAALDILRSSFLSQIPTGRSFDGLRANPTEFGRTVIQSDGLGERTVPVEEFPNLSIEQQREARRNLFVRRVRLLARAEHEGRATSIHSEYRDIWRHGHGVEFSEPPRDPSSPGELRRANEVSSEFEGFGFKQSIVGAVNDLIGQANGEDGYDVSTSSLFRAASVRYRNGFRRVRERLIDKEQLRTTGSGPAREGVSSAHERLIREAIESLQKPLDDGIGLASLTHLDFLSDEAASVNLRGRRYAFLMLQDHPAFRWARDVVAQGEPILRSTDSQFVDVVTTKRGLISSTTVVDEDKVEANVSALNEHADNLAGHATRLLQFAFAQGLLAFQTGVERYQNSLAAMEEGSANVERDEERRLQNMLQSGSEHSNRYVLDGEALQMENGIRLWDYFYEAKMAGRKEFNIDQPEINDILSNQLRRNANSSSPIGGERQLRLILDGIEAYVRGVIEPEINGIHGHRDLRRRDGYTLAEALEDEVAYRALYLSNRESSNMQERAGVRQVLARFNAQSMEERERLTGLRNQTHRDYLRDKVSRIVTERAQILCYYDNTRDQQGGVRPCRVFLASINAEFAKTRVGELLKGGDFSGLQWCDDNGANPREVVFYRAVLNVPLYVFGRMDALRNDYNEFRNLARRPKVLHIDKNWENSLQDLDPTAAIQFHRTQALRRQVIGFGALFVLPEVTGQVHEPIIAHSLQEGEAGQEAYWILRPRVVPGVDGVSADRVDEQPIGQGERYQKLGKDLRDSVASLPGILRNNPVAYRDYQQVINGVYNGVTPGVLRAVCDLVIRWKTSHDSRRESFGGTPSATQRARLDDLAEAYTRLAEALDELHASLSERFQEIHADSNALPSNAGTAGLSRVQERDAMVQSIEHLERFQRMWRELLNPESSSGASSAFNSLFGPVTGA